LTRGCNSGGHPVFIEACNASQHADGSRQGRAGEGMRSPDSPGRCRKKGASRRLGHSCRSASAGRKWGIARSPAGSSISRAAGMRRAYSACVRATILLTLGTGTAAGGRAQGVSACANRRRRRPIHLGKGGSS
jgi:hypothetical protein